MYCTLQSQNLKKEIIPLSNSEWLPLPPPLFFTVTRDGQLLMLCTCVGTSVTMTTTGSTTREDTEDLILLGFEYLTL